MSHGFTNKIGFAILILGVCVLYTPKAPMPGRQADQRTPQQIQAAKDKEEYLKTRPWYERASAWLTDNSKPYTKVISKALGTDERAVWDIKRKMDSPGMAEPLDYYRWLEGQNGKR